MYVRVGTSGWLIYVLTDLLNVKGKGFPVLHFEWEYKPHILTAL